MSDSFAYICNANCQRRYGSSDQQIESVKKMLESRFYTVLGRGCLGVCSIVGDKYPGSSIVNVELTNPSKDLDGAGKIAATKPDGSPGIVSP